jgi:hypothetical protein
MHMSFKMSSIKDQATCEPYANGKIKKFSECSYCLTSYCQNYLLYNWYNPVFEKTCLAVLIVILSYF